MGLKKLIAFFPFLLLMQSAYAHCPLCTAGAAFAAGGAAWIGISKAAIGIFIGAFAVSTGWWASNLLKKKYIPFQKPLLILFSFAATIIPLIPLCFLAFFKFPPQIDKIFWTKEAEINSPKSLN